MKVTAQIAAYNEGKSIAEVINAIPKDRVDEIMVVVDSPEDSTIKPAEELGARVVVQKQGKGFGFAHRQGFKSASGDIVVIIDADSSQNPKDVPRLLDKLNEGYDVAMGSRYMKGAKTEEETPIRYIGNKMFTILTNLIHGTKTTDSLYFFMAAKKEVFNSLDLKSGDFALCIEVLVKLHKAGYKIAEVPCIEAKRFADDSRVNALVDGFKIMWQMLWW